MLLHCKIWFLLFLQFLSEFTKISARRCPASIASCEQIQTIPHFPFDSLVVIQRRVRHAYLLERQRSEIVGLRSGTTDLIKLSSPFSQRFQSICLQGLLVLFARMPEFFYQVPCFCLHLRDPSLSSSGLQAS